MGPPPAPWIRHCYISEMVEDRWVHAARRLTSIEFSFDPCNIYCDGPRGVGYPADARSVGDSHPSCSIEEQTGTDEALRVRQYLAVSLRLGNSPLFPEQQWIIFIISRNIA